MYFSYQGLTPGDIELVKKFPQFLSASTRNIFNFVQEHHWTMYSPFHSTSFCHFLGSFIFPSSQQLLSFFFFFLSKDLFQVPFIVFQGIENVSHYENLIKSRINGNLKVQYLVNTVVESEFPSQAVTVFAWSSKKYVALRYPDGRLNVFCNYSGWFSSRVAFRWYNWEQYVLELIIWFSRKNS